MWSITVRDYAGIGTDAIVDRLRRWVSDGDVVLLHDDGGKRETVEALEILLEEWSAQGYQFKSVCEPPDIDVGPRNQRATGVPTINGPPRAGDTLTADTAAIADQDGMDGASFSYRWMANGVEIEEQKDSMYVIAAEDEGKTIIVEASFVDDAGNTEIRASFPTAPVTEAEPAAGAPAAPRGLVVEARANSGELAVSWDPPTDNGASTITGYRVEWRAERHPWGSASDVSRIETSGTSHTIASLGAGTTYAVRVRARNDAGAGPSSATVEATTPGPLPLRAGFQTLPGRHHKEEFRIWVSFSEGISTSWLAVREHLLRVLGGEVMYAKREDGRSDLWRIGILPHGTEQITVIVEPAADCTAWRAICTRDGKKLSNRLEQTVPGPNRATGTVSIGGIPEVGQTIAAELSQVQDQDGIANAAFSYQWIRTGGGREKDIAGATDDSSTVVDADGDHRLKVRVSFTDDAGNDERLTSGTVAVAAPLWAATLTAQTNTSKTPPPVGYSRWSRLGQVSPSYRFTLDGVQHRVMLLFSRGGMLFFGITPSIARDFAFSVGNARYVASDAMAGYSKAASDFAWAQPDVPWAAGDNLQVRLTAIGDPGNSIPELEPAPPTAYFDEAPRKHDGTSPFEFQVHLNSASDFDSHVLQNESFTVAGGEILNTRPSTAGSTRVWQVTARPTGSSDMVIVLPAADDCDTAGAVCTSDGHRLFNRVELTVAGTQ